MSVSPARGTLLCLLPGGAARDERALIDWMAHQGVFCTTHVNRLEKLLEQMDE